MIIFVRLLQSQKAPQTISVTVSEIVIQAKFVQWANIQLPIVVIPDGIETLVRPVQLLNASESTDVNVEGKVILVSSSQSGDGKSFISANLTAGNGLGELVEEIAKLTLTEAADLVKALEEKFGVSAAAMSVAAAPAAAGAAAADAPAAKADFDIMLKDIGANKINVIKVVKDITGLGLGDAKALVESAPKVIKEKVPAEEAKKIEAQLKEAGATVELK